VPVLISRSIRSLNKYRCISGAIGIVQLSKFLSPRSNSSNVNAHVLLMRGRRDSEGMEQALRNGGRGQFEVLSGNVAKVLSFLELKREHFRGQPYSSSYSQVGGGSSNTNQFVHHVQKEGSNKEGMENRNLHQLSPSVHQHQGVEAEGRRFVEEDEGSEPVSSEDGDGEDHHYQREEGSKISGDTSGSDEEPPSKTREIIRNPVHFSEEASKYVSWLCCNTEEVDHVTKNVNGDRTEAGNTTNEMEIEGIVERNDSLEWAVPENGANVLAHGEKEEREGVHHRRCSSSSGGNTITGNSTETSVLSFPSVRKESLSVNSAQNQEVE